jgi:hypothetical protein
MNSKDELKWSNLSTEELYEIAKDEWSKFSMKKLRGLQTWYEGILSDIFSKFTNNEKCDKIITENTIRYDAIYNMKMTATFAIDYKNFGE